MVILLKVRLLPMAHHMANLCLVTEQHPTEHLSNLPMVPLPTEHLTEPHMAPPRIYMDLLSPLLANRQFSKLLPARPP
jgi:hypothetical protein